MNPRHGLAAFAVHRVLGVAVAMGLTTLAVGGDDWPQWRGPDRLNASKESGLLKAWPVQGPPLVWRATGIGLGIHPVSVAGGSAFTMGNREGGEFVFAIDSQSGKKRWATRVGHAVQENPLMRWLTQRSPTVAGAKLYTLTVNGDLVCLRVSDGQKVWQKRYVDDFGARRPAWGFCDHPMVDGDRLICSPFAPGAIVAALDKESGEVIWRTSPEEGMVAGYAALVKSAAGGIAQYLLFHGKGLAGFAAEDGRVLWHYARANTRIASSYTPIPIGDLVLSPNGYGGGLALFEVVRDERGLRADRLVHTALDLDPFQDCTAVVEDRLYLLERGVPVCVDAKTGSRLWGDGSGIRGPRAALTWADGHLYIRTAQGTVTLVQTLPEGAVEKSRFQIPEHEESVGVTSPVLAGGRLWIRDNNRLFCYDVSEGALAGNRALPNHVAIGLTDGELGIDPEAPRPPRVGVNRGPDAIFLPTPQDIVARMLEVAGLKQSDVLVDLGSGDGRIVIEAAKRFGSRTVGYEIDARLVGQSREAITREGLGHLARIEHEDIFTLDLSGADVITVFLYPRLMERLIPQFEKLKPGSRIVSHQFEMPGVKPDQTIILESKEDGDQHRIHLWITPLKKSTGGPD